MHNTGKNFVFSYPYLQDLIMKNRLYILPAKHAFLFLSSVIIMSACNDEIDYIKPPVPVAGNYFPTTKGSHWTYEKKSACDGSTVCFTTHQSRAEGEELEWDPSYEPYASATAPFQFVKAVDHEYFGYGYYVPQYKFLDDALPKNRTWVYYENQPVKEEFSIVEVNADKVVSEVTYHNVIVVRYTYFTQMRCQPEIYEPVYTITRYYAKDIGEIYMRYVYDYRGTTETIENSLIDYFIAQP